MRAPALGLLLLGACAAAAAPPAPRARELPGAEPARGPDVAHLGAAGGDDIALRALAGRFAVRNPGYALAWRPDCRAIAAARAPRLLFVHGGRAAAEVLDGDGTRTASELSAGDLVVLRPFARLSCGAPLAVLEFTVPEAPPGSVPVFVRPDQDPRLTDTPGGCATETGAYRRILLTWQQDAGPYTCRCLNAHRVRITDSFTHYHPRDGGFDEFYLVQAAAPGARLLTSDQVERIERPETVTRDQAAALLQTTALQAGDLVYLPRGLAHRGLGGVLAQVIAVPGFVPGQEIGLDHHLRAINARLGLAGSAALPLHAEGAAGPVVR